MIKRRKVLIVIEETGEYDGMGFNCYLSGDIERLNKTNQRDLSPAEYWGLHLFRICGDVLKQTGASKKIEINDITKN